MNSSRKNGQPAWCYYDNDPRGLAPEGWHIPTDKKWTILKKFLDISTGGWKLKSVEGWNKWKDKYGKFQNGNGDNSSGFNALPGGYRFLNGGFTNIRSYFAFFWSSTESTINSAWNCFLYFSSGSVSRFRTSYKSVGASVRCLRD